MLQRNQKSSPKEEEINSNSCLSQSNNKMEKSQFNLFNQAGESKEIKLENNDENPYGNNNGIQKLIFFLYKDLIKVQINQ